MEVMVTVQNGTLFRALRVLVIFVANAPRTSTPQPPPSVGPYLLRLEKGVISLRRLVVFHPINKKGLQPRSGSRTSDNF